MKIALLAPAWFAVPPMRYGGIEWVVSILADGLVDRGHDVTLFAAGESRTKAHLVTAYDDPPSYRIGMSLPDLHHTLTCLERAERIRPRQRPLRPARVCVGRKSSRRLSVTPPTVRSPANRDSCTHRSTRSLPTSG